MFPTPVGMNRPERPPLLRLMGFPHACGDEPAERMLLVIDPPCSPHALCQLITSLAVHVSEKLRSDKTVMAQVENNTKDQAMKANLPQAAIQIIVGAMQSHQSLATKLLSDETTRGLFLDVVYELLKRDGGWDLMQTAR